MGRVGARVGMGVADRETLMPLGVLVCGRA